MNHFRNREIYIKMGAGSFYGTRPSCLIFHREGDSSSHHILHSWLQSCQEALP